jgi:hypothetical protein
MKLGSSSLGGGNMLTSSSPRRFNEIAVIWASGRCSFLAIHREQLHSRGKGGRAR